MTLKHNYSSLKKEANIWNKINSTRLKCDFIYSSRCNLVPTVKIRHETFAYEGNKSDCLKLNIVLFKWNFQFRNSFSVCFCSKHKIRSFSVLFSAHILS